MANGYFVVQNGLQIGGLTIHAGNADITGTGNLTSAGSSTSAMQIAAGTTAQRPGSPSLGMIRYNSSLSTYEGFGAGSTWGSLGGVKSVDGKAYIQAETSAGAGDDVIRIYAGDSGTSTQVLWASTSNINILPTTTSVSTTTGALQVAGGVGVAGNVVTGGQLIATAGTIATGAFTGGFSDGIVMDYSSSTGRISVGPGDGLRIYNGGPASYEIFQIASSGNVVIPATTATTSSTTGALVVKGGVGVAGDMYIDGTLTVANLSARSSTQISVQDPMLYLTANVVYPWTYDTGIYSDSIGGAANTYVHHGMVRNYNTGEWTFFSNVKSEPGATVNWADAGLAYDTIKSGTHLPGANVTYALGSSTAYWSTAYINALTATGITVNSGKLLPGANSVVDIGSTTAYFNNIYGINFYGTSTTAKYADLAENYQGDSQYLPGQVLMFGGEREVTIADPDTTRVAGVVSTNPAHLMNGALSGPGVVAIALQGRVPCNVIGPVKKGDLMVSAGFGFAKVNNQAGTGQVIGKALNDFSGQKGQIEVVVGRC